ncbi:hypothetical protein C8R43DRAFT_965521 [Mycena crocata]|nr:hypothetical protein C8R43DRAFT_965521 [Mycena crocata]
MTGHAAPNALGGCALRPPPKPAFSAFQPRSPFRILSAAAGGFLIYTLPSNCTVDSLSFVPHIRPQSFSAPTGFSSRIVLQLSQLQSARDSSTRQNGFNPNSMLYDVGEVSGCLKLLRCLFPYGIPQALPRSTVRASNTSRLKSRTLFTRGDTALLSLSRVLTVSMPHQSGSRLIALIFTITSECATPRIFPLLLKGSTEKMSSPFRNPQAICKTSFLKNPPFRGFALPNPQRTGAITLCNVKNDLQASAQVCLEHIQIFRPAFLVESPYPFHPYLSEIHLTEDFAVAAECGELARVGTRFHFYAMFKK